MSKKMRMLQILNLWRLIPAYLIVYVSDNKAIIFEEILHWKKCTRRTEKAGFDIFSSLMLELKEYRTLLQGIEMNTILHIMGKRFTST